MAFQAGTLARNLSIRKAYGYTGELNLAYPTVVASQTIKKGDLLQISAAGAVSQYIASTSLTANTATTKAAGYATTSKPYGVANQDFTANSAGTMSVNGVVVSVCSVVLFDDAVVLQIQGISATVGTAQAISSTTYSAFSPGTVAYGIARIAIGAQLALSYAVNLLATTTGEFAIEQLNPDPLQTSSTLYPFMEGKIIQAARQY